MASSLKRGGCPCSLPCLVPGPFLYQGNPLLHQSHGPLENFSSVSNRRPLGTDLQKESSYDRCLQPGLGSSVQGQTSVWLLVKPGAMLTHQLPRDDGVFSGPKNLPASIKGAPCPGLLGQHDSGSLHQSPTDQ